MTRLPQGAGGFDMNSMIKQLQQVQADMEEAQEKLKDEVVEASAGGGMVKVKMSGDLRLLEVAIDPDAVDPEDAEMLAEMIIAAVNEALRAAQKLAADKLGGARAVSAGPAGSAASAFPASRAQPGRRRVCGPDPATDRGALEAPRDRPAHRPAARLPHPARARRGRHRLADAIREVKEKVGLCEVCFNLAEGPRCRICDGRAPRPRADLRGRGAGGRDPDRAHP